MGVDCEALLQQLFQQPGVAPGPVHEVRSAVYSGRGRPPLGVSPYATATSGAHLHLQSHNGGGAFVGRKSKYCSPAEKKAVAEYAAVHGVSL
jgi:hypothetical protein